MINLNSTLLKKCCTKIIFTSESKYQGRYWDLKPTDASAQTTIIITSSSETKAKPEEANVDSTDTTPVVEKAIPVEKDPIFQFKYFSIGSCCKGFIFNQLE
jgi:hypothetical protein